MLETMLGERPDGTWAAFETCVIEPRQNGKTDTGQVASLYDLFIRKVSRIVWSAHRYRTTADTFTWFSSVCENYDHLRKRVQHVHAGTGEQQIKLLPQYGGGVLDFLARATGSGRGLDGDVVNLDEALYLSIATMGTLVPIMSAKWNPQLRSFSSAGVLSSEVLRGMRDRARAGAPRLAWAEWACPRPGVDPDAPECADPECDHLNGAEGCLLDDLDFIGQGNPARGRRITDDYLRDERRLFGVSPDMVTEHIRERFGWWEDPPTEGQVDDVLRGWDAATTAVPPAGRLHLGVAVSHDSRGAAIVACGGGTVTVVDYRGSGGTTWLAPRLAELRKAHQIAGVARLPGPAAAVDLGDDVTTLTGVDASAASVAFAQGINEGSLLHHRNASADRDPLDVAVQMAVRAYSGDGWRWSLRQSRGDISPLHAAVAARHLASADLDYDVLDSYA